MEETDFSNLAEQVGGLVNQCRQWKQRNAELEVKLEEQSRRIQILETENLDLQRHIETVEPSDTADDHKERLLENRQRYAPNSVIHDFMGKEEKPETISYENYSNLAKCYEQLFQENASLIESFFTVKKKLKSCKGKATSWKSCFERDAFEVYVNGKKVLFRRDDTIAAHCPLKQHRPGKRESASTSDKLTIGPPDQICQPHLQEQGLIERSAAIATLDRDQEPQSPVLPSSKTRARMAPGESPQQPSSELGSSDIMSTQTQDPRYAIEPYIFPSSPTVENPIFVLSRPVRGRKKENKQPVVNNAKNHRETGSFTTPITVKSEPMSTSPFESTHSTTNDNDIEGDGDDDCLVLNTSQKDNHGIIQGEHAVDHQLVQLPGNHFLVFDESEEPGIGLPSLGGRQLAGTKHRLALQPVNTNVSSVQNADGHTPNQRAKRRRYGPKGVPKVHVVAEDEEEDSYLKLKKTHPAGKRHTSSKTEKYKSPSAGRLEDLLETVPRQRPILNSPFRNSVGSDNVPPVTPSKIGQSSITPQEPRSRIIAECIPSPRQPLPPISRNLRCSSDHQQPRTDDEVLPEDEPFRARPLHRLGFEHFKLNPERNQGLDYAFDEVVRRKDLRRCLPACIRPECCGKGFRTLAKLKGFATAGNNDESLEYLDQEDREVLDEYLGDNRVVLETTTEKELRELLLDARTRYLANKFGKHRHAHERARSPPGFWRTDMPSTQELDRDREDAKKAEQEKLAERHKEAMRPGGIWRFADE
ncbi:peroxisomal membrane protein PEX16 [Histoplasma ohiense]|nr:peroxisomal membrane protein PEX16 [Histoplasma ohiense (nom. inval.)]